jgi:D-3-phosphoglycerate dehydrogenase
MRVIDKLGRAAEVQQRLREMGVRTVPNLDALIDQSDILSFHLPAVPETRGMVNSKFLEKLHPGTILINTSRGDLVDEQALIRVLDEKALRVGLDVYRDEPGSSDGKFSSVLACHPSVYGTHHIGASTAQAQSAVAKGVLEIIVAFGDGRILNCVNMPS